MNQWTFMFFNCAGPLNRKGYKKLYRFHILFNHCYTGVLGDE